MLRRLVTLCAVLGYVAGQMAAHPHVHAGSNPPGHSSAPHVHLSWFKEAPHSHDHDDQRDHHHGHHHQSDKAKPASAAISYSHDHDADALYFAAGSSGIAPRDGNEMSWAKVDLSHAALMYAVAVQVAAGCGFSAPAHPPDRDCLSCDLYLQLRTLRI